MSTRCIGASTNLSAGCSGHSSAGLDAASQPTFSKPTPRASVLKCRATRQVWPTGCARRPPVLALGSSAKGRATSNSTEPRIRLLGGFSVAVGDNVVADRAWRLRKAKALVKILALAPDRRVHRERLAELLWPDHDADAAANNLNQALYCARRAFDAAGADGAAAVVLIDGAVVLRARVDVDAFETAAARARADRDPVAYERALDLHGGALVPEDRYEPWADARRAALTELHTALCLELADLHGNAPAAVVALQRALRADPLAEAAHRALMRLYARTGRRQQALAQYQLLRQSLSAELAAEPDPATRALYQQLLAPTPPTAARGGNLPRQLTSFVGRERERAGIARLLRRARLVTLTGPGGCGKTRLALEAAADALAGLPDGAWFVDLASVSDHALVAQAAALAVGVPIPASRSAQEALVAHLATCEALLVLDNCEHLIDVCARLAEEVLRGSPGVRILATSREPLRCADEVAWRVPSLAEAERLFCERAAAARPGFDPADGAAGVVGEICRRLDGMPLAIELAAARAAALSLDQIAARLGESLDVLGAGRRTALTRQQTLRATIDWSHDLLTDDERVLYRRLAVFAGGFTLEAAEAVCAGGAISARQVVDLLARLVEKSLVVAAGERFRLLDTVRQYAAERLEAASERDAVARRHLDWCLALAQEHDPLSAGQERSLQVLETEHDNLRTALAWAVRRDPQAALGLATRLWRFWLDRGYFAEGNRWLQTALAAAPEHTPLRVEALLAGAGLSLRLGDPNGFLRHVSDAVSAYRLLGDDRATAAALYQHAMLAQYVHRADAEALFAEALALARRLGDDRLLAVATHASATLPWYRGDNAAARARVLEALALLDAAPDDETPFFDGVTFGVCVLDEGPNGRPRLFWEETVFLFHRFARAPAIAYALNNLAWVARADGDLEQAQATLDDALARFRRLRDRRGEALTLAHMGNFSRSRGDFEAARAHLEEALAIRSDLGDRRAVLSTRLALGLVTMTAGDAPAGRALLSAALAHAEAVDDLPAMACAQTNWAIGEERLGELERAARLYEDGCALLGLQRLQRPEAWGRMALHDVCVALGDEPRALTALQRARTLFVAVGDVRGVPYTDAKPALSAVKQPGT
jgi:predicted ATPase/DNA-binding SARP family transcriptional activator